MPDVNGASAVAQDDIRGGLPVGTVLGGYELNSILGKGGFGITYRARSLALNQDVAIKEYLPTALAIREGRTTVLPISTNHAEQFAWGRERFLDEARTLERLDRAPAIVRVLDFLEANGTAYMVMALVEGETLNKRLMREPRLAPGVIERLLFPLLDGLEQVHALGFLHRDIKPANIMVDPHDRPTLIDFGASRAAMAGRSTTLTAIFTPGYAAAEQFVSSKQGPWTDIYGLAATIYHATTGRIPPSAIERIMQDAYLPLSDLHPSGYAPGMLAAVDAAMAVRADDRPQTIAEWRQMLRFEGRQTTQIVRKLGLVARAARRTRRGGITIKGGALGAAVASALVLLAGGGYLAWMANAPTTVSTAALSLSTEQLEQALAERRKADDLAAEKRRLEVEARQKAVADAEVKRQADVELEQARQARQKAEQELAQLRTDMEKRRQTDTGQRDQVAVAAQRAAEEDVQRKAEVEATSLRQAEEEAAKRAAADAEAKRQSDEALAKAEAERQRAEADARAKAEAETAARRQAEKETQSKMAVDAASTRRADEAQAKAQAEREKADAEAKAKSEAETAERGLRLESADRQRLQVALTSLGFDTRGSDGVLGSRSREMIAGWQKKAGATATGYLTAAQRDELLRTAALAVTRWEEERKKAEEQKKLEDDKKKSDAAQAGVTPASPSPPTQTAPALATASPPSAFDGTYTSNKPAGTGQASFTLAVTNGRGSLTMSKAGCNVAPMAVTISPTGEINGQGELGCPLALLSGGQELMLGRVTVRGRTSGGNATLTLSSSRGDFSITLDRSRGGTLPAPPSPTSATSTAFDGTYSGNNNVSFSGAATRVTASLQVANGRGSGTLSSPGCSPGRFLVTISPAGEVSGEGNFNCVLGSGQTLFAGGPLKIAGDFRGKRMLDFRADRGAFTVLLEPGGQTSPAAVASPDGLWRGTFGCERAIGSFGSETGEFSTNLEMRLANGSGTWKNASASTSNGHTVEINLSVGPSGVSVNRTAFGPTQGSKRSSLSGQYDGSVIQATGKDQSSGRQCTLSLTRA